MVEIIFFHTQFFMTLLDVIMNSAPNLFMCFVLQTRRPLVQHTPDIPKQQVSRWSPVRRTRLLSKEDQAIQCTKRFHQTAKK